MIKLLELLIFGHSHTWEEVERNGVADDSGTVMGYAVFCRCSKCGSYKRFNLY
jgi:hypothetical protein